MKNMKSQNKKIAMTVAAFGLAVASSEAATTIIGAGGNGTNTKVDQSYGDAVTANVANAFNVTAGGTPNINLTWGGDWEYHAWSGDTGGNGVLQNQVDGTHTITFTPDAGFAAVITSFNFIGDTNSDTYQFDWRVVDAGTNAVLKSGSTASWTTNTATVPFNAAPVVNVDYTGTVDGQAIRLELVRNSGNDSNIAIDNLTFDQVTIVPEPSSTALLGLGGLVLILRRRK